MNGHQRFQSPAPPSGGFGFRRTTGAGADDPNQRSVKLIAGWDKT